MADKKTAPLSSFDRARSVPSDIGFFEEETAIQTRATSKFSSVQLRGAVGAVSPRLIGSLLLTSFKSSIKGGGDQYAPVVLHS